MPTKKQNDPYAEQRAMSLIEFINTLFDQFRDDERQGLYLQREDGHWISIKIRPENEKIIVIMDDVKMGYFESMDQRGYKCSFHQRYRQGIKKGLLPNEAIIKSICSHPLILFYDA